MADIVQFKPREYTAKQFTSGQFEMSGTLCGNVDFTDGVSGTWCLTVPDLDHLIASLRAVREDVVNNSQPFTDKRIVDSWPI